MTFSDGSFPWPDGVRAAASFTFDVDAESCVLVTDPAARERMSLMGHQAYGPRVGTPRLLRMLERHDIRTTFFVPGYTADCYPDTVRAIIDGGHEIAHHGYLHEPMRGIDAATEARYLDQGLEALDKLGVRPVGYRAPWWETNWHTPALLAERGFRYDTSLLDDDVPYRLDTAGAGSGSIIEIPVDWALDDWEQYAFFPGWTGSGVIEDPDKVRNMWWLEAYSRYREGGCFVLTNHPFLSGRPAKSYVLERLIEDVAGLDGVWIAPLREIAEHAETVCGEAHVPSRIESVPTPTG